ncbi:hypothetical protein A2U01_0062015, partial [Trifolium medium]|nr:hypothetical protein [Trifolium medium]
LRAGLLLAPGGEFAFVAFGEAVNQVFVFEYCFPYQESVRYYYTLNYIFISM